MKQVLSDLCRCHSWMDMAVISMGQASVKIYSEQRLYAESETVVVGPIGKKRDVQETLE